MLAVKIKYNLPSTLPYNIVKKFLVTGIPKSHKSQKSSLKSKALELWSYVSVKPVSVEASQSWQWSSPFCTAVRVDSVSKSMKAENMPELIEEEVLHLEGDQK